MRRRTLLQRLWSLTGVLLCRDGHAQSSAQVSGVFSSKQQQMLRELASIVLPSDLGSSGFDRVAAAFEGYVRDYRPGADTEHGYGVTHVSPKPGSPANTYRRQLDAFPSPLTKAAVETSISAALVKELPRLPDGKSIAADLISFYFRSSEANDLCYSAAIKRDECRGLVGLENPPAALWRPA